MTTLHSKIGASSMSRWSRCPGSVRLSADVPPTSSPYAEEGTKAHELAADWLNGKLPALNEDPEMVEAVRLYVETVQADWRRNQSVGDKMFVEHRFDLSEIYSGLFGTADCVLYNASQKLLRVFDFKYGAGIAVDVDYNEQLMYYGLGALLSLNLPCDEVELVIVQPRCPHPDGPVRRWRFPAADLLDFASDLEKFARATEDPNAPLNPGEHCQFCPAKGICPALHEKALAVAKEEFSPALSYDPQKLAHVLNWLPVLETWIKGVREFAYGEALHGRTPPGWKLVQKRATRRWAAGVDANTLVNTFGLGFDEVTEEKLRSPAQVEKLLDKTSRERLSSLIVAESSGYALAPEDDPREPAKLDAASEFKTISPEDELLAIT